MWHPKKNLDPFLPVFSHFFMSYFDVFGSIFEKSTMTDLPKVIVSICLVSYNICMIPHVWRLTFGLNLSGAWGEWWAVEWQDTAYCFIRHILATDWPDSQVFPKWCRAGGRTGRRPTNHILSMIETRIQYRHQHDSWYSLTDHRHSSI